MKFANLRRAAVLALAIFTVFLPTQPASSQDEFAEDGDGSSANGLFDDEDLDLEPLDDADVQRPNRRTNRPRRSTLRSNDDEDDNDDISPVRRPSGIGRSSRGRSSSAKQAPLRYADQVPNSNEKLRMDFVQVDIAEVVKYFSERIKKKFIYDPSILSGKITIISPTEVTVGEAWEAFLSAMEIRGYVVYPTGQYLKIEKVQNARKSPIPLYMDRTPGDDSYVTRIITLKFLSVNDIRQAVRDLVSRGGGDVIEHSPTNTLIISDYAANIRRIVRILKILDVEGFQEQIAVVTLKHASAQDIARKINEIFQPGSNATTTARRTTRRRTTRRSSAASSNNESVLQKVVADDRTNSLILLGSERGIEQVKKFIDQIDVPIEGGDGEIHVYPLQNVKAEDLSQTLASLTAASSSSRAASTATTPANTRTSSRARTTTSSTAGSAASSASLFNGEVKVTADPRTNSLIVQASPRDFEVLKGIIKQLDIRRRQVFIESVILEASVNNLAEHGAQASGPIATTSVLSGDVGRDESRKSGILGGFGTVGDNNVLAGTLQGLLSNTALTGLALGFQSGGTVEVNVPDGNGGTESKRVPLLSAIVRLAATNGNLNVLSTPHILATANEEAVLSIGEEIPQIASTQPGQGSSQPFSTFNRIRVATELTITPQINSGDYLTLNIDQKVNEIGDEVAQGQTRTTTREAKTTAIVRDGQTIVIGGIMRDRTRTSITKVPLLGDIPILGWLFKSRSKSVEKVNLLLFITPHIIRDTGDMDDVFFKKLKQREGFLSGVGMDEKRNVPLSGYSRDQLEFLDEDYIKSLQLTPLPNQIPTVEVAPATEGSDAGTPSPSLPPLENQEFDFEQTDVNETEDTPPSEREDLPLIPIMPRPSEEVLEDDVIEFQDNATDVFDAAPPLDEPLEEVDGFEDLSEPNSGDFSEPPLELPELPEMEPLEDFNPSTPDENEGRMEPSSRFL